MVALPLVDGVTVTVGATEALLDGVETPDTAAGAAVVAFVSMIAPPGSALPTVTTVPLLRIVTPLRASESAPGFALVTGLQLVPFN